MKKKTASIIVLCLLMMIVLLIGAIGVTLAFYTSSSDVQNMLITSGSEVFLQEFFSPDDLWLPGETKAKEVWFGNQGELDQVIRFKVTVEWFDNKGTPKNLNDDTPWNYTGAYDPAPVIINWTSEITGAPSAWTKLGDYYYYNRVLEKQSGTAPTETLPVISSVTFSPAISNSAYYYGDDFSNKACRITITMESLDVSSTVTEEAWYVKFTQAGSSLTWSPA